MSSIVSGSVKVGASWACGDATNPLAPKATNGNYPVGASGQVTIPAGSAAGQTDGLYVNRVTVPASSTLTLNMLTALDPADNAVAFVRLTAIVINNLDTHGAKLTIGAGTDPVPLNTAGAIDVWPDGVPKVISRNDATGFVVTPTTGMNINLINASGNDITADLVIFGRKE